VRRFGLTRSLRARFSFILATSAPDPAGVEFTPETEAILVQLYDDGCDMTELATVIADALVWYAPPGVDFRDDFESGVLALDDAVRLMRRAVRRIARAYARVETKVACAAGLALIERDWRELAALLPSRRKGAPAKPWRRQADASLTGMGIARDLRRSLLDAIEIRGQHQLPETIAARHARFLAMFPAKNSPPIS
jgi:hypothetical protein